MNLEQRRSSAAPLSVGYPDGRQCPFCGEPISAQLCAPCGRDTTAPRRFCNKCGRMVPTGERTCWNCGERFENDLWRKVFLIVFVFLLAFLVRVVVAGREKINLDSVRPRTTDRRQPRYTFPGTGTYAQGHSTAMSHPLPATFTDSRSRA
jgi:predicted nucleic acid-binding Zn ribbon protein